MPESSKGLKKVSKTTGNVAVALLKAIDASADAFPPLKSTTRAILHIVELVSTFRSNKEKWVEFGEYIGDAVALIVHKMGTDSSQPNDPKEGFEGAIKKLQDVLNDIENEISEIKRQGKWDRLRTLLDDPDKISNMKEKVDNALNKFHLSTSINMSIAIKDTLKKSDIDSLSKTIVANIGSILDSISKAIANNVESVIVPQIEQGAQRFAVDKLPLVEGATWNPKSGCMDGTREALIADAQDWVSRAKGPGIYRLIGMAGSGKSAFAHEIARRYHQSGILAASFFFDREIADRSSPKKVWSTIAREMAGHDPLLIASMAHILEKDPSIVSAPPLRQFQSLILETCNDISSSTPVVIVIDALDEGLNTRSDEEMLAILRDELPKLRGCYCVFLTSRPNENIEHYLSNREHVFQQSIELDSEDNRKDVASYIRSRLNDIAERHNLDKSWPKPELLQKFIERAEGLFIWVSTVCEYILLATDPEEELEQILVNDSHQRLLAEEQMDRLYELILSKCNWDEAFTKAYPLVMGAIVAAKRPLSASALQIMHHGILKPNIVKRILRSLGAVLTASTEDEGPLRIIHQSFRDFITVRASHSPDRSRFSIVEKVHSARLAILCIKIINEELNNEISGAGYLKLKTSKEGIPQVEGISEQLWYACEFWISHLESVESLETGPLNDEIHALLGGRLILWIEVVTSKGTLRSICEMLHRTKPAESETMISIDLSAIASALYKISLHLTYDGRLEEACTAANDAAALWRILAKEKPAAFNPDLATSLNDLSNCQRDLGYREEALASIEEAVKLRRHLAKARPARFNSDLASSLNNLSTHQSDLGRREEALESAEEAVELNRLLVNEGRAEFNSDLASSLNNLCGRLAQLGHHEEALKSVEEAVELRRLLAKEWPVAFNPVLAQSLHNLALCQSKLGRHKEALASVEEAVELNRLLADERPATFNPDLAMSLNSLSNRQSLLRNYEEALKSVEEAVELYRHLTKEWPARFNPSLASSLHNLSVRQSDLGRPEEALGTIKEAVELRRLFAKQWPAAFNPVLADSLHNLSALQAELGFHEEALKSIEEAVVLYRLLAKELPAVFNSYLASSRQVLSIRSSRVRPRPV